MKKGIIVVLVLGVLGIGATSCSTVLSGPQRLPRAEAFLGIHFDFHAGKDCTNVGQRTTPEMVSTIITKVHPDFIQIDCKGHPGYSSYPTKVGNPAPGFVGDPLRIWREVTRAQQVALFMHYSGVWDYHTVKQHRDWAAVDGAGKPSEKATSVFSPYVDQLMIPQLRELAGDYRVDGVWVDGDCWGVILDYSTVVVRAFCKQTGATAAPRKPSEPFWQEWKDFNREGFRRYLRHYVDELKKSHPKFEVISNWAFSNHMPEPVTAQVAALSGDFSPHDSVNAARFSGRCLENQGKPWDLMSWSFTKDHRRQKSAVQLEQEAANILALGGGYQAYFTMNRDGSVRLDEMDVMAAVAKFCRERQRFCHKSVAVPQVALLYSRAAHYREANTFIPPSGLTVLRNALTDLLQAQQSVQIVSEHHLAGQMKRWPLIVVPGCDYLEPAFRDELAAYVKGGGQLLLIGAGSAKLFTNELGTASTAPYGAGRIGAVSTTGEEFIRLTHTLFPNPLVTVTGSTNVDVCVRRLAGQLMVNLVNTAGPHADKTVHGFDAIPAIGPLTVTLHLLRAPKSVVLQPEGRPLNVNWANGQAVVTVPRLDLYSILAVKE